MKGFFSFVRKETLHILRDRRTMLIVLLMPVVQLLLFGFAISVEVNNIDFAVVASHPTEAVRRQVERIAANPYFISGGYIAPGRRSDRSTAHGTKPAPWSSSPTTTTGGRPVPEQSLDGGTGRSS